MKAVEISGYEQAQIAVGGDRGKDKNVTFRSVVGEWRTKTKIRITLIDVRDILYEL
jgi:hypothetical protein